MLTAGITQLEIAAALPYRIWQAICRRIILLRGPGFVISESGYLEVVRHTKHIRLVSLQLYGRWPSKPEGV